jgi:hypothetical protein
MPGPLRQRDGTFTELGYAAHNFLSAAVTFAREVIALLPRLGNRALTAVIYGSICAGALYLFIVRGYASAFVGGVQETALQLLFGSTSASGNAVCNDAGKA